MYPVTHEAPTFSLQRPAGAGSRPAAVVWAAESPLLVATARPQAITSTSAVLGGSTAAATGPVVERGIVYSATIASPTLGNGNKVQIGNSTGHFSQSVSLSSSTTYYARAYAIGADGTSYGQPVTFRTLAPLLATVAVHKPGAGPQGPGCSAAVEATGGAAPYAYSWRNTSTATTLRHAHAHVHNLAPGHYTVTVTDGTGATTTASALVP